MNVVFYGTADEAFAKLATALRIRWAKHHVSWITPEPGALDTMFEEESPDIVVLGPSVMEEAGPDVVGTIHDRFSGGIIVLAGQPSEKELLEVVDAGADDYLPADAGLAQFVARVYALWRRIGTSGGQSQAVTRCGSLSIDAERHLAHVDGDELYLTPTEFKLLYHLAQNDGKLVTQDALHRLIWDCEGKIYIRSLRKYIERLRKRLEASDSDIRILTVPRLGYRLLTLAGQPKLRQR
jgi:DNA-binding response OmpR family regulator